MKLPHSIIHHPLTSNLSLFAIHPPSIDAECLSAELIPTIKKATQMKKTERKENTGKAKQRSNIRRRMKNITKTK